MALAIDYDGQSIATIESLERNGQLHLIQKAFIEEDGLQCGFCTPGQVMAAKSLLDRKPNPTPAEIRQFMAGNLCRCGAYPKIVRAVLRAAHLLSAGA
jgi:aerobic-type carbon monoxide dehydrogenase small subunit (CoxS/CutS family)